MRSKFFGPRNVNPGVAIAYVAIFIITLLSGTLAFHNVEIQERTASQYIEAERTADLLEHIENALTNAEAGQRGYLLTGQLEYLQPYKLALEGEVAPQAQTPIAVQLREFTVLISRYAQLGNEPVALAAQIEEKLAELRRTVELYQAGKRDEALALVRSNKGRDLMDGIRNAIERIRMTMNADLQAFDRERAAAGTHAYVSAALVSALSVIALCALMLANRNAHQRIRHEQEQINRFFESGLLGVTLADVDGGIERANDEYLRIVGYSRDDLEQGRLRWDAITPPEWLEIERAHIEAARKTGASVHYEKEYLRKDGSRVPVMLGFTFTDDARRHVVSYVFDITEQKRGQEQLRQQEEQLQQENRRKDEFIAVLAHELRNPLAPVQTGLDLMKLAPLSFPGYANTLSIMDRQLGHLVRLIDDLLDVSRINAGKLDLRLERIAAVEVVNAALEAIAPQMAAAGQTLDLQLPDDRLFIRADPVRMTQVLNNLLNNAVGYSPQGSCIRLTLRREGQHAVFEVSDRGIGIEPALQPMVFDMFAQADSGQRMRRDGLGLGLSLAKRLVQMHGGSIALRSAPGEGSNFIVSIPTEDASIASDHGPDTPGRVYPGPVSSGARRILVLDDNVDAATMLGSLLGARGHAVRYAHCGADAIALASAFRPDIAFLDIGLPDMSGYDVARALRAVPELAHTRLVALTGWGAARDKEASRNAGIDLHLTKPARIEEICALMPELG